MEKSDLTELIIAAAMKVHTELGPGVLESAYEVCLEHELRKRGLKVERQKALPIEYDGIHIDCGYRIDLLVEDEIVIELKAVEEVAAHSSCPAIELSPLVLEANWPSA